MVKVQERVSVATDTQVKGFLKGCFMLVLLNVFDCTASTCIPRDGSNVKTELCRPNLGTCLCSPLRGQGRDWWERKP